MINTIMITLTLFGGGALDVNRTSIDAIEEGRCSIRHTTSHWFSDEDTYEKVSCRQITLKSGQSARVLETREEILKKINNG